MSDIGIDPPIEELIEIKDPIKVKMDRKLRNAKGSVWVLAGIIALNTIASIFIGNFYERSDYSTGSDVITSAISSYKLNDASSTTVYNQMVTNGWVAKDLLVAIGNQNATIIEQNIESTWMIGWLLFNILFTLGWLSIALIRIGLIHLELTRMNSNLSV
jgi:hypothetical protein